MPRPATGQIVVERRASGTTYALRFRADGKRRYETLGTAAEGWTPARAEEELQNRMADVRRGRWQRFFAPSQGPDKLPPAMDAGDARRE